MKTKDLISITLKIIGLIAFWKAIQAFVAMISVFGKYSSILKMDGMINAFSMFTMVLAVILSFVLPLVVAFFFLFRTENVLSILKIKDQGEVALDVNKLVVYHMLVIAFGFIILIHGAGGFMEFNYSTNTTKTEYIKSNSINQAHGVVHQPGFGNQDNIIESKTTDKNFNYLALIEIIIGIVLLKNATGIAKKLDGKIDLKQTEE
ncbi:MAG: hypothetical protein Q4F84_05260 [Fibrobacter sp.]|nr:hypothetical protein [Fibrobacter sp.]